MRPYVIGISLAVGAIGGITAEVYWTKPVRESVAAYTSLIAAANAQDIPRARSLCTARYVGTHSLKAAPEGGLVGLPRNIHKNFRAWCDGPNVRLCPTDQVGPLYQFLHEDGAWKFDGPIGILQPRGRVLLLEDEAERPVGNPDSPSPSEPD
jgi:hypothetical protein